MTQITPDSIETPNAYVSWGEFLGSAYAASLALVCLAVWLHAADSLIVATMLPSIVAEIGGAALVSWSVSIYEIGSIVAGAAAALLTMRYGLRGPMSLSAALFGAGCALSAMSPTMTVLLVGRGLQGLGGGGLVAMCFLTIGVLFPRRYAARALAAVSTFWGISAFLGPLIGGFFVEYATWRLGFWFFAAQAFGLALWIALRGGIARPAAVTEMDRFPVTRLALLCLAVVLISLGGVRVEPLSTTLYVGAGLACLGWFLWRDNAAKGDRLLPAAPIDPRHATGATLLMLFLLSMATVAILAYGPLLMVAVHGTSALVAGYIVAASSVGWTLTAVLVSGAPERQDRAWITAGMAMTTLAVAGFAYAVPQGPLWLIAVFALFEGGGFGLAWTFILRRITALVAEDEVQRVSGAMPTVQRLGYALGAAYVGIIANASGFLTMDGPAEAAHVAGWVFLSCVPLALAGLMAMWGLVRRHAYDATLG
ncbi:MFS transporter [Sulfitobacter delicatus]|uniref:Major Facilitator Superfamily protein n=1 Tax=Sulfitobacter delicatus TaxID=218672 RepID=A0A1G7U5G0_9RHOB|nr:MFS transporter [Sulfitobacter delicatus]SDG42618.1 Major Facilitator Superfamily protein [Sulfitobacter delicatus]